MIIVKSNDKKKKKPHLALTHKDQGGPANGRAVSLVMKSVEDMSSEGQAALTTLMLPEKEEIEKASYQNLYRKLEAAVSEKARESDKWSWTYVRDFDDTYAIYSQEGAMYAVPYSVLEDGSIELGTEKISVIEILTWEDEEGRIIVSQSDSIPETVSSLVEKSFEQDKLDIDKVKEILKNKNRKQKEMDELKQELEALKVELEKAKKKEEEGAGLVASLKAELEKREKEDLEKRSAARKEVVKSLVPEADFEEVFKSLEALDETSFETITKSMKNTKEALEKSEGLFKQASKKVESNEVVEDSLAEILKNYN